MNIYKNKCDHLKLLLCVFTRVRARYVDISENEIKKNKYLNYIMKKTLSGIYDETHGRCSGGFMMSTFCLITKR